MHLLLPIAAERYGANDHNQLLMAHNTLLYLYPLITDRALPRTGTHQMAEAVPSIRLTKTQHPMRKHNTQHTSDFNRYNAEGSMHQHSCRGMI